MTFGFDNRPDIVFAPEELMPAAWSGRRDHAATLFNPAIVRHKSALVLAYRVVTPDGQRRLACCRLDAHLRVIPGSIVPFSDTLDAGVWHADPRFCQYQDRLLLHYNSGGHDQNQIFLVELDPDTLLARAPARPLALDGARRRVEKNWMLFEWEGDLLAVYQIAPHVVLRVDPAGTGPIECVPTYRTAWDDSRYRSRFGELRGGGPPVRVGDSYFAFFHSLYRVRSLRRVRALLRRGFTHWRDYHNFALRYVGGFYGFGAAPPFAPQRFTPVPVLWPPDLPMQPQRALDPRVESIAYPSAAIWAQGSWLVAYGADNRYCCLKRFDHAALLAATVVTSNQDQAHSVSCA